MNGNYTRHDGIIIQETEGEDNKLIKAQEINIKKISAREQDIYNESTGSQHCKN